jgi:hypothetical protein
MPSLLNFKQPAQTITTTSTAVDTSTVITYVNTSNVLALTLANGSIGQLKFIIQTVGTNSAVITPTNLLGGSTLTFNAIGSSVILLFTGTDWVVVSNNGVTVA